MIFRSYLKFAFHSCLIGSFLLRTSRGSHSRLQAVDKFPETSHTNTSYSRSISQKRKHPSNVSTIRSGHYFHKPRIETQHHPNAASKMPIYFKTQWDPYGELSNLYLCEFEICARDIFVDEEFDSDLVDETITVFSAEQAIAWMKAILMKDDESAETIYETNSPKECSRLGREVSNFDIEKWESWREEVAVYVLKKKFTSSERLFSVLEKTRGQSIAEANANDHVWGIGIGAEQARKGMQWRGQNLLGRSLMAVRETLLF